MHAQASTIGKVVSGSLINISASQADTAVWLPSVVAIGFVILGRAAAIYPICMLFSRSDLRVTLRHQHALLWGGLRGALALALALGLPAELPRRAEIVSVSFAVVAFSVSVQGLTMPPLLRAIGEIPRAKQWDPTTIQNKSRVEDQDT